MMPDWLVDYLDSQGVLDSATRLTRRARLVRCRQCGAKVLAGLDDLTRPLYCEQFPTTAPGELQALMGGRRTYTLIIGELCLRDEHRIAYRSASGEPVHAEHQCYDPAPLPMNLAFIQGTPSIDYDEPPF